MKPLLKIDQDHCDKIEAIVEKSQYGDLTGSMIKDRIVDSHSHERLLRKNDLTLEKTMKISKAAEVAKLQSEELCSVQFSLFIYA